LCVLCTVFYVLFLLFFCISRQFTFIFFNTLCTHISPSPLLSLSKTRKMCYCKDDRTLRPIYGCPENFQDCLTTPMATFLKISWAFVLTVPSETALVSFYRLSIVTFPLSLRLSEILPFLFFSTPLFSYPPLVSPKFLHVPL